LIIKRGFPPRPATFDNAQTLQEARFSPREKLIVSVDEEMLEKLKAERDADMDPLEVLRREAEEEKKTMQAPNQGCDPS